MRIINGSAYYVFTLAIGDDIYEGVSVNVLWIDINTATKFLDYQSGARWYLGKWGEQNAEMENGLRGNVHLNLFNFVKDPVTGAESFDYMTGTFSFEGFGRFNHHTLLMTVDTRGTAGTAGYCTVLGNRHKA